jgi:NDP-sugar pyrophosphorylase family protein
MQLSRKKTIIEEEAIIERETIIERKTIIEEEKAHLNTIQSIH